MKILLNKVFTGGYLKNNLGHELKNFLVCDDGTRGIFIVPHNRCSIKPDYVFHLIESSNKFQKQTFEIVGISEVSKKEITNIDYLNKTFKNKKIYQIFDEENGSIYRKNTFISKKFYTLKENKKIYIIMVCDRQKISKLNNDEFFIELKARFGQAEAMHTFCKDNDTDIMSDLINNLNDLFEIKNDNLINYDDLKSELPMCIINDRVSLEDSMSNMIAYFLKRDKQLLKKFLENFLKIEIDENEEFEIIREEKNVDIILKSKNKVIVIENKIKSNINGIISKDYSQLTKYYEYISNKYKNHQKYFFILKPNNNYITNEYISQFKFGNKYLIKNYSEFYNVLKGHSFNYTDEYGKFIFDEFVTNIQYLTWTKAKQIQYTSFIYLKQIIGRNN